MLYDSFSVPPTPAPASAPIHWFLIAGLVGAVFSIVAIICLIRFIMKKQEKAKTTEHLRIC